MAIAALVNLASTGKAESFQRIRDFLCKRNGTYDYSTTGVGWTLHDSYYAVDEDNLTINDWFVIKSVGENGKQDLYVQFKYITTLDYLSMWGWLYWNNTTHAGVTQFSIVASSLYIETSPHTLWITGDLDSFYIISTNSLYTTKYCGFFNVLTDTVLDNTIAISALAADSGAAVEVTVDAVPDSWVVDGWICVRDNANIERAQISAITGLVVTLGLANSYAAGFKLAEDYCVVASSSNYFLSTDYTLFGHNNLKNQAGTPLNFATEAAHADPDPMGEYFAFPFSWGAAIPGILGNLHNVVCGAAGYSNGTSYTTADGQSWRCHYVYSTSYILLREL